MPLLDAAALTETARALFPAYACYPVINPLADPGDSPQLADPIDDLVAITLDLREALWLADNVDPADGHWSYRINYGRWGTHARQLGMYLLERILGGSALHEASGDRAIVKEGG